MSNSTNRNWHFLLIFISIIVIGALVVAAFELDAAKRYGLATIAVSTATLLIVILMIAVLEEYFPEKEKKKEAD